MPWIPLIVVIGLGGAAVAYLAVARSRARRGEFSSVAGTPFTVVDELYHPSAYQAKILFEERREAVGPSPSPADPAYPENRITLYLAKPTDGERAR